MSLRRALVLTSAVILFGSSAWASQPNRYALKMLSNPPVFVAGDDTGLPTPGCGFGLAASIPQPAALDPTDTLTLDLALVPFQLAATAVYLYHPDTSFPSLALNFADGRVNGIAYNEFNWNDIRVDLRVATQDYDLTVNGVKGGPFPLDPFGGPFTAVSAVSIARLSIGEDIGWFDSFSLTRNTSVGSITLLSAEFDVTCLPFPFSGGAGLVVLPPKKFRLR